jgi:hypothetical protein
VIVPDWLLRGLAFSKRIGLRSFVTPARFDQERTRLSRTSRQGGSHTYNLTLYQTTLHNFFVYKTLPHCLYFLQEEDCYFIAL